LHGAWFQRHPMGREETVSGAGQNEVDEVGLLFSAGRTTGIEGVFGTDRLAFSGFRGDRSPLRGTGEFTWMNGSDGSAPLVGEIRRCWPRRVRQFHPAPRVSGIRPRAWTLR